MFFLFMKGLYLGICTAAPVGPIGIICIRSVLQCGWRHGLSVGLGAACADAIFGGLAAAGLAAVFFASPEAAMILRFGGAAFLLYLGYNLVRKRTLEIEFESKAKPSHLQLFRSTLLLTLANPMTITSFVAIFSACGLTHGVDLDKGATLVFGVFLGSLIWWLVLSMVLGRLRERLSAGAMSAINRLSGLSIIGFAFWSILN